MPDWTPYISPRPAGSPRLGLRVFDIEMNGPRGVTRLAWADDRTGMWVDSAVRNRSYVCSEGVEHRRYWRRHQKGGSYPLDMRCEHEVVETMDPQAVTRP